MASGRPQDGYRNSQGERVPGTTTIIGRFKDSGGLLYWAAEQGRLMERGIIKNLYDKRDEAADAGSLAHDMVFQHIRSEPVTIPENTDLTIAGQAQNAFNAYLSWASMTKLEIVEQEFPLVSEKYQFGGTPDAVARVNQLLSLTDWKSSNKVYGDYLLQLAAYDILIEECRPDLKLTGGYHLCRFAKSYGDFAHHYWPELEDAKRMFLMLRECYDIDRILKKRAA